MSLKTITKVGTVYIKIQSRDDRYYLVYRDSTGKPISKSTGIKAETARQLAGGPPPAGVMAMARDIRDILGSRFANVLDRLEGPFIGDAINKAIDHAKAKTEERRADLKRFRDYFVDWVLENKPHLSRWDQVTGEIVLDYVKYHHGRGVKPKSLQHYISILTLTANHWHSLDSSRYHPLRVKSRYLDIDEPPEKQYLTASQTFHLLGCAYLRRNRAIPRAVMLGCFAGCNIKEIIRIQVRDVDLDAGTLSIRESKNKYRRRTIPLIPILQAWLAAEIHGQPADQYLVTNTQGFRATHHSVGLSLRRLLNSVAQDFNEPAFKHLAPKDIRKTFVNLCVAADVALSDIAAYVGHGPAGMTGKHYADMMQPDRLQRTVTEPLQVYLIG